MATVAAQYAHKPAQRAAPKALPKCITATAVPVTTAPSLIQRACACGGRCSSCAGRSEDSDRIQAKVAVGAANDPLEAEADRAAAHVMRMVGPAGSVAPTLTSLASSTPTVEPQARAVGMEGEEEAIAATPVNRRYAAASPPDDSDADLTRGGQPLPADLRAYFEPRFGRSFESVRLHQGVEAERRTDSLNALAFTYGNHIWLGAGQAAAPSALLAHELAHVVQQRQPARLNAGNGPALGEESAPQVRRFLKYWEPANYNGDRTHNEVLTSMGRINRIFTEVPVPNANARGSGSALYGYADFFWSRSSTHNGNTLVGVKWDGHNQPAELPAPRGKHIRKSGNIYRQYPRTAAPKLDDASLGTISRVDRAPEQIWLGDLKPWNSIGAAAGPDQLDNYSEGFQLARAHFNDYQHDHPSRTRPTGQSWSPVRVGRFQDADNVTEGSLTVPQKYQYGQSRETAQNLIIKENGRPVYRPSTAVRGRLYVARDRTFTGIWSYFWVPLRPIEPATLSGLDALGRSIQRDEIDYLRQAPVQRTRKPRPHSAGRPKELIQRRPDPFVLNTYQGAVRRNSEQFRALQRQSDFPNFRTMLHAVEVQNAMSSRVRPALPAVPVSAGTAQRLFSKADLWTGRSAGIIGRMRHIFGHSFVKVMDFYQRARQRMSSSLQGRSGPRTGFGSGLAGAAVRVAFNLLKLISGIVIQRTVQELSRSLVSGVTNKLNSMFNPEELLDKFLDPEQREAFEAKLEEYRTLREELETKATDTAEQMVARIIGPYEDMIANVDNVRRIVTGITQLVNLVRWGARVIACLSPPAWGCLWILAQAVLEHFASLVVETCWFKRRVSPLIASVSFIREMPRTIAGFIITKLKEHVLPDSLHDVLPDPASVTTSEVRPEDIPCDEAGDGAHAITPERRRLMEMQERLGEEKFLAFMRLAQRAGIPSDRQLTLEQLSRLETMLQQTDTAALQRLARNYRQPENGTVVDVFTFLEQVRAEPTAEPAAAPPPAESGGGNTGDAIPESEARRAAGDGEDADAAGSDGSPALIQQVDGRTAQRDTVPELSDVIPLASLVLNPRWSHTVSNSTIYPVDVRLYENNFQGPARYVLHHAEMKVLPGGRSWWPSESDQRALRIRYTYQHHYLADPSTGQYLRTKGTNAVGYVDRDSGRD